VGLEVWTLKGCAVEGEACGGGHVDAAADVLELTGEGGEADDGLDGAATTIGTLDAIVDANDSGVGGGEVFGELLDGFGGDSGELFGTGGRHGGSDSGVGIEVVDVLGVGSVFEVIAEDDVSEGEGQGEVCAGVDGDVLVCEGGGFGSDGIDDDEAGPVAAGLNDEGPEVDVGGEDVGAPGEDELAVGELFWLCAEAGVHGGHQGSAAGRGADGAVEAGGSEFVEEAAVHSRAIEEAHGAGVGVRQDGLCTVFCGNGFQFGRDGVDGLGPGDATELAAAFGANAGERVEEAVWVVFAVEVFGDFAAEETLSDGVIGVAFEAGGVSGFVDLDED